MTRMQSVTLIGMLAGILTTLAFLPQVVKTWRTRSADDISAGMLLLFSSGLVLWLIYGIAIASLPIILANAVTLLLTFAILLMKWWFASMSRQPVRIDEGMHTRPVGIESE
jgi:MtN3 and saliva related transmembrane protein